MRPLKLFTTILILTGFLLSCGDSARKEKTDSNNQKNTTNTIEDNRLTFEEYLAQNPMTAYIPAFTKVTYDRQTMGSRRKHKVTNDKTKDYFKVDSNLIHVEIPVTSSNLKIVSVADVSTSKQNAIEIRLDGNNGVKTNAQPITHIIKSDMEISKIIGLDTTLLKQHKKLKIFVVHENRDRTMALLSMCIYNCVKRAQSNYNENKCGCNEIPDPWKNGDNRTHKPKEFDGSVLQGGN